MTYGLVIVYPVQFIPAMLYASAVSQRNMGFEPEYPLDNNNFGGRSGLSMALIVSVMAISAAFVIEPVSMLLPEMSEATKMAMEQMQQVKGLQVYGTTEEKGAVVAFNIEGIHHLDLGTLLDRLGIAIRTGHHCAQPLMQHYGVEGMARASFALYNTPSEVEALVAGIERVRRMF